MIVNCSNLFRYNTIVIPTKVGIQTIQTYHWIPAFAGMTKWLFVVLTPY